MLYQNFPQHICFQFVFHQNAIKTLRAFKNFTRILHKIWPHYAAPPKFDIFLLNKRDIRKIHTLRAAQITHFIGRAPRDLYWNLFCGLGKSIESHNSFLELCPVCRSQSNSFAQIDFNWNFNFYLRCYANSANRFSFIFLSFLSLSLFLHPSSGH